MKKSKRYLEAKKLGEKEKNYSLKESVEILKKMPQAKFDETVEISGKLSADPRHSDQMIRGSVLLPHGTGKQIKVLVFCEPAKEDEAKAAGADHIGSQELADKILKESWVDFDYCISTPSMMKVVGKLGRFLGPRGLMPSPKTGTVTENISYAVEEAKKGKIDFRMDKLGCIHAGVGKISFSEGQLCENIKAFVDALVAARPASVKGDFVKELYISATMSPSIKVAL
ncbi:MAG: 50S ribosomal protein L1 [Candidatus Omnitrophica bacterium]|nr:50S ribosomal protein L1 [Candidatus Omnitrophota bacterium]MBD3269854.1 50S ribosomal protein L1 [Candidatus Omnitrophota bacterium]